MPAWPGGPACRAGMARHRASTGRHAGRAVPRPCSCLANGPWHGPWAVLPCRAARWARPFSSGRAGPWPMMHTSQFTQSHFTESKFTLLSQFTVHTSQWIPQLHHRRRRHRHRWAGCRHRGRRRTDRLHHHVCRRRPRLPAGHPRTAPGPLRRRGDADSPPALRGRNARGRAGQPCPTSTSSSTSTAPQRALGRSSHVYSRGGRRGVRRQPARKKKLEEEVKN